LISHLAGTKPGTQFSTKDIDIIGMQEKWELESSVDVVNEIRSFFEQTGRYDIVPYKNFRGQLIEGEYIFAQKGKLEDFLTTHPLVSIAEFDNRVQDLIASLGQISIAEAIAELFATPPITQKDEALFKAKDLVKVQMEYPEVSILLGKLLGYRDCDVTYYVETRFGLKPKDPYEDGNVEAMYDKEYEYRHNIVCPSCFQEAIEQRRFTKAERITAEELDEYRKTGKVAKYEKDTV